VEQFPDQEGEGKPPVADQGGEGQAIQNLTKEEKGRQPEQPPLHQQSAAAGNYPQDQITSAIFNQQVDFFAHHTRMLGSAYRCMHS
jgi:hypothetical protein